MIIEITKTFKKINKVAKVEAFKKPGNSYHFKITTSNTKYDRKLMMSLLNTEYEIIERFNLKNYTFEYMPHFLDKNFKKEN